MPSPKPTPAQLLRTLALRSPEVEEGIACKGTAAECSAYKSRKKTFLFVRTAALMIKLKESLPEAARLASEDPSRYTAGAGGWVTVKFGPDKPLPGRGLLELWVAESYRLIVNPKKPK